MKKYNYTEEERAQIADARKNNKKCLAKIVNKIRKQCISENRFTEDVHSENPKAKTAKKSEAKEETTAKEEESAVEVHGVSETSVIIK